MNINFSTLKDYAFHALRSVFCDYQQPFNTQWDERLQQVLDTGELLSVGEHLATFSHDGDVLSIWIANRWYSYAHLYQLNGEAIPRGMEVRPRFSTMRRLHALVSASAQRPQSIDEFYAQRPSLTASRHTTQNPHP